MRSEGTQHVIVPEFLPAQGPVDEMVVDLAEVDQLRFEIARRDIIIDALVNEVSELKLRLEGEHL